MVNVIVTTLFLHIADQLQQKSIAVYILNKRVDSD